jgi:hypothetical protein
MTTLRHAFKEWAVICRALAEGQQAIILRKGGIAENQGNFEVEQRRFWLYPTFVHQQHGGVVEEAFPLMERAIASRPPVQMVRLSHFAEVHGIFHLHDIVGALKLEGLHLWSRETVQTRFFYREPGMHVLAVRVYRAAEVVNIPETAEFAGCRSWVDLGRQLSTEGAEPVLEERTFANVLHELERRLEPMAWV